MSNSTQLLSMAFSLLALSVAMNVRADDSSSAQSTPPDRAAVEAAMSTCRSSAGVSDGTRSTREQHEKIAACMKAAGFEKAPRGPHGGHGGDEPPPPPPDDAQPINASGSSSSGIQ